MPFELDSFVPELRLLLFEWLPLQPWFDASHEDVDDITVIRTEVISRDWPLVMWVPVEVQIDGAPVICQTVLALDQHVPDAVSERFILGEVGVGSSAYMVYDALQSPDTAMMFVRHVAGDLSTGDARTVADAPWLTTIDLGTQWELSLYRRVEPGPHPDVEIPSSLAARECQMVRAPAAVWRKNHYDLATVRLRTRRGTRGSDAATASVDALLELRVQPRENPLDIAHDCYELGETLAEFHVASANHFGMSLSDPSDLIALLTSRLPRQLDELAAERVAASYRRLAHADDLGMCIRIHGNLGLECVTRERQMWIMTRFGCDPDSSVMFDREPISPLSDLASLIHSIERVGHTALRNACDALDAGSGPQWENERSGQRELTVLAEAWEQRCVDALIAGYTSNDAVHRLLPVERVSRDALLTLFELERSVRDTVRQFVARPDLVRLPTESIEELASNDVRRRW